MVYLNAILMHTKNLKKIVRPSNDFSWTI